MNLSINLYNSIFLYKKNIKSIYNIILKPSLILTRFFMRTSLCLKSSCLIVELKVRLGLRSFAKLANIQALSQLPLACFSTDSIGLPTLRGTH